MLKILIVQYKSQLNKNFFVVFSILKGTFSPFYYILRVMKNTLLLYLKLKFT